MMVVYIRGQRMNITRQKEITLEVLHKLEAIDPFCILAGGAPRNWFLGKEANDLDFYVHLDETLYATELRFKRIGLEAKLVDFKSDAWKQYGIMEHLFRIFEVNYKGVDVQIMCMKENTFQSVIPCFGVSICMFWWKGGKVIPTDQALISLLNKTLYIKDNYSAKELHVEKMIKYFPDFKIKDYNDCKVDTFSKLTEEDYNQGYHSYYNNNLLNKLKLEMDVLL